MWTTRLGAPLVDRLIYKFSKIKSERPTKYLHHILEALFSSQIKLKQNGIQTFHNPLFRRHWYVFLCLLSQIAQLFPIVAVVFAAPVTPELSLAARDSVAVCSIFSPINPVSDVRSRQAREPESVGSGAARCEPGNCW